MRTIVPTVTDELFPFAGRAADGCHTLGAAIGITHNTEARIRTDLTAGELAQNLYDASMTARALATQVQAEQVGSSTRFIYTARDWLKHSLGRRYSQEWGEVGFPNHSLSMPRKIDGRIALCRSMELYLTAHPDKENQALNVTHTEAGVCHGDLEDRTTETAAAWEDQRAKRNARDLAVRALRKRMSGLIGELKQLIAADDPRWETFGFNIPADHTLPDVPQGLTVIGLAPRHLFANWPSAAHAQRYHIYKQVVGVDDDFVFIRTVTDTSADLNTFTSGQQVKIELTAVNDAGESLPCEPVEQTVP